MGGELNCGYYLLFFKLLLTCALIMILHYFCQCISSFDRDWKKIEAFVGSKTVIQVIDAKSLLFATYFLWEC